MQIHQPEQHLAYRVCKYSTKEKIFLMAARLTREFAYISTSALAMFLCLIQWYLSSNPLLFVNHL